MKGKVCLAVFCSVFVLAGCSSEPDQLRLLPNQALITETEDAVSVIPMDDVALANCNNMGGMPTTLHNLDGSAVSKCQLSNGKRF